MHYMHIYVSDQQHLELVHVSRQRGEFDRDQAALGRSSVRGEHASHAQPKEEEGARSIDEQIQEHDHDTPVIRYGAHCE